MWMTRTFEEPGPISTTGQRRRQQSEWMGLWKRLQLSRIVVVRHEQPRRRGRDDLGKQPVSLPSSSDVLRRRTAADEVRGGRPALRQPLPRKPVATGSVESARHVVRVKRQERATVHHDDRRATHTTSVSGVGDHERRQLVGSNRSRDRRRSEVLRRRSRETTSGSAVSGSGFRQAVC